MTVGNLLRQSMFAVRQDGLLRWVARLAAKRGTSLTLIAAILIVDLAIPWAGWSYMPRWQGLSFVPRAFVDEPCAVATALIVLGAITRFRGAPPDPKFGWSLLAWSVLIDIDHLPEEFGSSALTEGTARPYGHALWTLVVLILAILAVRYWSRHARTPASGATTQILAGTAWGIAAHFLRDVATAPMSLWWPVTDATVQQPYWWYVVELLVIVALPVRHRVGVAHTETSKPPMALGAPSGSSTRFKRNAPVDD
jgi:inner membrane protein